MKLLSKEFINYILIILSLLTSSTIMIIGYTKLTGITEIQSNTDNNWDVHISSIKEVSKTGGAYSISEPIHTIKTGTLNIYLGKPNDSIKYEIKIKNGGNIDAKLDNFYFIPTFDEFDILKFETENIYVNEKLSVGEEKTYYLSVIYNNRYENFENSKEFKIIFDYVQY